MRFPEFKEEWNTDIIENVAPLQRGFDLPTQNVEEGNYPVVYSNGILRKHKDFRCEAPGLVTGRSGSIGNFTFIPEGKYWPHNTSLWVTNFHGNNPLFVYYLYQTINIGQYATGSGVPTLNRNDVHKHKVSIPTVSEQHKLAEFLSLIDERIATQIRIIEDLKKLRLALIETMYRQSQTNCKIGDVIVQVSSRNRGGNNYSVLSVNNRLGFIEQSEQFEDRNVASDDTSNYKIVNRNDFAYNPARINVGSIARLTSFETGIVSPMYICFQTKRQILPEYMEYFFHTHYFYTEMQKRLEGSVRMCLSWEALCNIPIKIPSIEQQQIIGKRVTQLANKIELEERFHSLLTEQKSFLLKMMFI